MPLTAGSIIGLPLYNGCHYKYDVCVLRTTKDQISFLIVDDIIMIFFHVHVGSMQ